MISVIVPVDDRTAYLRKSIESIRAQTWRDIEILCVCDGRTRGAAIIAAMARKDPRIRCLRIPKGGPGAARNAGLEAARGAYIAFCDSDDILPYRALEKLERKMRLGYADVVMGSFLEQFDSGGAVRCSIGSQGNGFERFFCFISVWNRLYRADFLRRHGLRFVPRRQGEDLLFLADVFLAGPRVAVIPDVVYQWQRHERDKVGTLTHSAVLADFLELLESWDAFLMKMEPRHADDVARHGRDACPYLLDRLANIRDREERAQATERLRQLLPRMGWRKYPVRFLRLFRYRYDMGPDAGETGSPAKPRRAPGRSLSLPLDSRSFPARRG